jgi:hypothetical protein
LIVLPILLVLVPVVAAAIGAAAQGAPSWWATSDLA